MGVEESAFSAVDRNQKVDQKSFDYVRCPRCAVIRLKTPPRDLSRYYKSGYYALPGRPRLEAIAARERFKIDLVRRFVASGRLVDIGAAFGVFAFQAKNAGYQVQAIEMDSRCCAYLRDVVGVEATQSDDPVGAVSQLAPANVITLWHVIEHVPDPWALIKAVAARLARGGILIIATPNPASWQFGLMGAHWPHVDAPRHLYLLPSQTLIDYARQCGLAFVNVDTDDADARRWNWFGWQRLLMNLVPGRWLKRIAYVLGTALGILISPLDRRKGVGAAYTLILRKDD